MFCIIFAGIHNKKIQETLANGVANHSTAKVVYPDNLSLSGRGNFVLISYVLLVHWPVLSTLNMSFEGHY